MKKISYSKCLDQLFKKVLNKSKNLNYLIKPKQHNCIRSLYLKKNKKH